MNKPTVVLPFDPLSVTDITDEYPDGCRIEIEDDEAVIYVQTGDRVHVLVVAGGDADHLVVRAVGHPIGQSDR